MTVDDRDVQAVLRLHERVAAIYADPRFPDTDAGGETRALAVAMTWARYETRDIDDPGAYARTFTRHMGMTWEQVVRRIIRDDAPRYEPPDDRWATPCPIVMRAGPRRGEPCGRRPNHSHRVTDPKTGQWTVGGWCSRHEDWARASYIAEQARMKAGGIPEPLPNRGGLLPCHVPLKGWPDYYKAAMYSWTPPRVGIRADDWPTLAKVVEAEPPRLVLVAGRGGAPDPIDRTPDRGVGPRVLAVVGPPDGEPA